MKFQYSEKKVKLPGNVHAYAEKKVMKLARFFEEDAEALIVFSVEKNQNNVELTVHGAGTWFRASESTSDMFASIDAAVATIEGQIRKNKTRLARRLRQDAFTRTVQEETSFVPETEEDDLSLKKVKSFYFKPMTREEAVMQMNLPNVYIDTAHYLMYVYPGVMEKMYAIAGADHIVFGTDAPLQGPMQMRFAVEVIQSMDIPDGDKAKILYKNAQKVLGL